MSVIENLKNAPKNWKKVKASPYASLEFSLKVRKVIVFALIVYIAISGINMAINYRAVGFMSVVGRVIMLGVIGYLCYKIYQTIPQAKKQIDYYKKYPHTINYCPTDTKETVDSILNKIKENQQKEVNKNVRRKNQG